jgi:hypothetical protein
MDIVGNDYISCWIRLYFAFKFICLKGYIKVNGLFVKKKELGEAFPSSFFLSFFTFFSRFGISISSF